ncbi:MAG: hypothetical protein U9O97_03460 [Elusimicrobiota bacterium]|nr:hypothetical protein [Elusimicrobiota bacterium]
MNHWIKIDIKENYVTGLKHSPPLAAVPEKYKSLYLAAKPGDVIWFYAIRPVRGIVGFAKIEKKYRDEKKLVFIPELRMRKVLFPLRFRLKDVKAFERKTWIDDHINIGDFKLEWTVDFQPLLDGHSKKLIRRAEKKFEIEFLELKKYMEAA